MNLTPVSTLLGSIVGCGSQNVARRKHQFEMFSLYKPGTYEASHTWGCDTSRVVSSCLLQNLGGMCPQCNFLANCSLFATFRNVGNFCSIEKLVLILAMLHKIPTIFFRFSAITIPSCLLWNGFFPSLARGLHIPIPVPDSRWTVRNILNSVRNF